MTRLSRSAPSRFKAWFALPAILLAIALAIPAVAAPRRVALVDSRVPAAKASALVRRAGAGERMGFQVALGFRDPSGVRSLVAAVSDPSSPSYGNYLTPEQFRARFSRSSAAVQTVSSWLRAQGFRIGVVPEDHLYVSASGTVAQVEQAFGVGVNYYRTSDGVVRAASGTPTVPAELSGIVQGVVGMDGAMTQPMDVPVAPPAPASRTAKPCSKFWAQKTGTSLPKAFHHYQPIAVCGYTPQQFQGAYGTAGAIGSGNDGSGVTVAVLDAYASPTLQDDLDTFSDRHGLPRTEMTQIVQPPSAGTKVYQQGWYVEQTLDVEAIHAMAPGAHILYEGAASAGTDNFRDAQADIIDNARAQIISNSTGFNGEQLPPRFMALENQMFQQAAAEGIGVYFSSGDNGDEYLTLGYRSTDWEASSPYVTAVGGTTLGIGKHDDYQFETGWGTSQSLLSASNHWKPKPPGTLLARGGGGGGTSFVSQEPSYQAGVVPEKLSGQWGGENRVVPDVAMDGDNSSGFPVGMSMTFPDGKVRYIQRRVGGTSLSCPLFAGMMALADQRAGFPHGFANPALYAAYGSGAFRDVVNPPALSLVARGSYVNHINADDGYIWTLNALNQTRSLHTKPGYDNVTGLGTPNGESFLSALG